MNSGALSKVRTYADLVKFEHTIFALPLAYVGMFLAAGGWPTWGKFVWITVAMVGARTAAMSLNRLVDAAVDAVNPRTATRHIPMGTVGRVEATVLAVASLAVLGVAAWQLNPLCLQLFPLVVVTLVLYSYTKRFTWTCHFWLGFADGWAPFGAFIAVTGVIEPLAWLLMAIVTLWIGGFDVLYATQDLDFDRRHGIHSIPARFGLAAALKVARLMHLGVVALIGITGWAAGLIGPTNPLIWGPAGWLYATGWVVVAALLHYEHSLLRPDDLSRLDRAFFQINSWVSVAFFIFTAAATVVAP